MAAMSVDQRYTVSETKGVHIPMRDGVRLSANLILPDDGGPVPAIIVYLPYLKDVPWGYERLQHHFAQRGYACLEVDIRGIGGSEGQLAPPLAPSEKQDAVDLNAWVAAQPWCSGATGMWGLSYSGSTALA